MPSQMDIERAKANRPMCATTNHILEVVGRGQNSTLECTACPFAWPVLQTGGMHGVHVAAGAARIADQYIGLRDRS